MYKKILLAVAIIANALVTQAQSTTHQRYKDLVFKEVIMTKNVSYVSNPPEDEKKAFLLDIYQPKGDKTIKRPLIIWMHGGGFKFGNKEATSMKLWCKTFAQRGYVCAAINYRLSKHNPLFHFDELQKSSYYAVLDAKKAVEFLRKNALPYGIDPDKIILAGNSAGGIIALQAAYSTNTELAKMAGLADTVEGAQERQLFKVAGVINLWGGIYDLRWLENKRVPIVNILGDQDSVVPPTHKSAPLYGGIDIHTNADSLGIPNKLKIFKGYSHELQRYFNPFFRVPDGTKGRWVAAGQFAADFLYEEVIK